MFSIEDWRDFILNKIGLVRDYTETLLDFWNFLKGLN